MFLTFSSREVCLRSVIYALVLFHIKNPVTLFDISKMLFPKSHKKKRTRGLNAKFEGRFPQNGYEELSHTISW